jgi:hypothetical protein
MPTGRRVLAALVLVLAAACARQSGRGELAPPAGAAAWDARLGVVFDDHYTGVPVPLSGRAPSDVTDQRRFAQRLGYADLVALVTVEQVWSRGLYGGAASQRLDVTLDQVLLGELPKGTRSTQVLQLRGSGGADELPAGLTGRAMLLFVRWAPGDQPAYHHHVMPADSEAIAVIEAMVRHARAEGKLPSQAKKTRASRRARRKAGKTAAPG